MREQGLSWWKRRLVAPIVALMRGSLEAKLEDMVRFAYFEVQLLAREPRFSPEERSQYLDEYAVKIGLHESPDFSAARAAAEELEAAGALEGESEESGALMQER